ncbi:hypothetical protein HUJ05_003478 [Dendroctonus ponderosae]|nr:hypothetical protein HUJ05_003478 [Dendroctonus ponderosae]
MDWVISDELSLTVGHVVGWISAGAMVVGGIIPYIPQYRQIKRTKDADGFSLLVCLALLIANTLRILFWFGKHFEYPLLAQSLIMIATMFAMIHLCVRIRNKAQLHQARQRIFTGSISGYMKWFLEILTLKVEREVRVRVLDIQKQSRISRGFVVFIANLPFKGNKCPSNYTVKASCCQTPPSSAYNCISMVVLWTCGDIFKTLYFLLRDAPVQFWVCGSMQVAIDLLILLQVFIYRGNTDAGRPVSHRID